MAINTADRRRASLGCGMPWNAGTLIPSGSTSVFRRGTALGLYSIVEEVIITDVPDYMHGTLSCFDYLRGTVTSCSHVAGSVNSRNTLVSKVQANP